MIKRRMLVLTVGAVLFAACATISVKSPDGSSSASYSGTSILGSEGVSCGAMAGVETCSVTGQDLAGLAQAIVPYLGPLIGVPAGVPAGASTPRPTPAPAPSPVALESQIN